MSYFKELKHLARVLCLMLVWQHKDDLYRCINIFIITGKYQIRMHRSTANLTIQCLLEGIWKFAQPTWRRHLKRCVCWSIWCNNCNKNLVCVVFNNWKLIPGGCCWSFPGPITFMSFVERLSRCSQETGVFFGDLRNHSLLFSKH